MAVDSDLATGLVARRGHARKKQGPETGRRKAGERARPDRRAPGPEQRRARPARPPRCHSRSYTVDELEAREEL